MLHDIFAVPFGQVAEVTGRTPAAARQLASRARRQVRRAAPVPDPDLARQRQIVGAFFAASRAGDLEALIALLDPGIVVRSDGGPARPALSAVLRGASDAAKGALGFASLLPFVRPALVNGCAGAVVAPHGRLFSVMSFTITNGKIAELNILADPDRLAALAVPVT